jgi:predicted nucleic acid-binding protein
LIGYLDTSALVKLLLRDEDDRETARTLIAAMDASFTSRIAYPEARAALAAARRAGRLAPRAYPSALRDLDRAVGSFRIVELHPALARAAGDIAERFALRALDAVHLASALALGGSDTVVVTWDRTLASAAAAAGLGIAPGRVVR